MTEKVVVIGAGLVGSMTAIYMARLGYDVVVYEKRPGVFKDVKMMLTIFDR
jgi:flavin-dependent dehydrogenase